MSSFIISIDGPAASGKGTLARKLADHFGFAHLDTGILYRAVGLGVLRAGGDPADPVAAEKAAMALDPAALPEIAQDPALRYPEASDAASKVAAIPAVRAELLDFQRKFADCPPVGAAGAVLDGRDIGTVVCPYAQAKLFVVADVETRAARRVKELRAKGQTVIDAEVLADMKERDARDIGRAIAPTVAAADAIVLDTSHLSVDEVLEKALTFVKKRMPSV